MKGKFLVWIIFIIAGIVLAFVIPNNMTAVQKRCTLEVPAVIISIRESHSDDGVTFAPVYQFELNGESVTRTPNYYTSTKPQVGEKVQLFINPDNDSEFFEPIRDGKTIKILRIIGIVFLCFSGLILFARPAPRRMNGAY